MLLTMAHNYPLKIRSDITARSCSTPVFAKHFPFSLLRLVQCLIWNKRHWDTKESTNIPSFTQLLTGQGRISQDLLMPTSTFFHGIIARENCQEINRGHKILENRWPSQPPRQVPGRKDQPCTFIWLQSSLSFPTVLRSSQCGRGHGGTGS